MRETTEESARAIYNELTDGINNIDTQSLANRNSRAIALLLAQLREAGLLTASSIDELIADAKR